MVLAMKVGHLIGEPTNGRFNKLFGVSSNVGELIMTMQVVPNWFRWNQVRTEVTSHVLAQLVCIQSVMAHPVHGLRCYVPVPCRMIMGSMGSSSGGYRVL